VLLLWLCGLACVFSGCASFRSVSVAASFGQLAGNRATAVVTLPTFCEAENILAGPQPPCPAERVQKYVQDLQAGSRGLLHYATALKNIADFNDPRLGDGLSQLLLGLDRAGEILIPHGETGRDQIAAAAGKLAEVLSQKWRRGKLESLVESSHPHVMALIDGMLARLVLLGEPLRDLAENGLAQQRMMLAEADRYPGLVPDRLGQMQRQADRLALLHLQLFARRSHESLVEYQKSLLAFKRAHTILFEFSTQNTAGLTADKEIYEQLQKDIPQLLGQAAK
jgi:hypothetical protein